MMKIKDIYLQEFGPHKDWSFTPGDQGVQLIYGPNESGKTSLLEGIRTVLFGGKAKHYDTCVGSMVLERDGKEYHVGRNGKKLDFYPQGEPRINMEPNQLWWHGLDKKTYNRIFALTLADLQGADILNEVEVRTRFFGAEGGERLSSVVKDIEKATNDLFVASANGKRKINVLMEQLKQNRAKVAALAGHETEYVSLQSNLTGTERTEQELLDQLQEWRDYRESIDIVLRAWDTYRRSEEAKAKIHQFNGGKSLERQAFYELDQELNRCHEHMRIWQGKEEGLMPENFSPDSPMGVYAQDIEDLYQQVSKWDQLRRECEQGEAYLEKVRNQLVLSRRMHTAWRDDEDMATDINWYEGERLAQRLRSARDQYQAWQLRKPLAVDGENGVEPSNVVSAFDVEQTTPLASMQSAARGGIQSGHQADTQSAEDEVRAQKQGLEDINIQRERAKVRHQNLVAQQGSEKKFLYVGIGASVIGIVLMIVGLSVLFTMAMTGAGAVLLLAGLGMIGYSFCSKKTLESDITRVEYDMQLLDSKQGTLESQLQTKSVADNLAQLRSFGYSEQLRNWETENKRLEQIGAEAMDAWQAWLPQGAAKTLTDTDFFGMKQEYDQYQEQVKVYEGYEKTLQAHKDDLQALEDQGQTLWDNLGITEPVAPVEMRKLYAQLKNFHQNKIRWEQKESQRKNFREEYDQWHRKEKDLLLRQKELLEKAGIASATEYRQQLLQEDQLKQWETIYKQSQVQLDLLAPKAENKDLFYRRLRGGDKDKWIDEVQHSDLEIASIEQKLASVYEQRGQIIETMRNLANDQEQAEALQERKDLEGQLEQALEDWVTQVLISHCMDTAQQTYEQEKQPHMMDIASKYIQVLTDNKYTLDTMTSDSVALKDANGVRLESKHWSSGLGDQVYLALRLSLAKAFSNQVEPLPIVLDDILVRFDEERQKRALALLSDIGKEQQVWVFTCQHELLRMGKQQGGIDTYMMNAQGATAV